MKNSSFDIHKFPQIFKDIYYLRYMKDDTYELMENNNLFNEANKQNRHILSNVENFNEGNNQSNSKDDNSENEFYVDYGDEEYSAYDKYYDEVYSRNPNNEDFDFYEEELDDKKNSKGNSMEKRNFGFIFSKESNEFLSDSKFQNKNYKKLKNENEDDWITDEEEENENKVN